MCIQAVPELRLVIEDGGESTGIKERVGQRNILCVIQMKTHEENKKYLSVGDDDDDDDDVPSFD